MKIVVVGAGISGLSAACHLRGDGHDVTVVERESTPGGRCRRITDQGFAFDIGATVLTMPSLIDEPLRRVGSSVEQALELTRLDPAYLARYADGSTLRVRAGLAEMTEEIRTVCGPADAEAFPAFVSWLEKLNDVELPYFIDRNYESAAGLLRHPAAALRLAALGGFGRLGRTVARRFSDPRLQRLFTFQALYAGISPADALALYAVITYMDSVNGVFTAKGGMYALPQALADAAAGAGVSFRYDTEVTGLVRTGRRVTGVQTAAGERIAADAVVCTLDVGDAYRRLLPDARPPRAVRKGTYSPSAVVWHLGVRGDLPDQTAHHTIHFGEAWDEAFTDLIDARTLMRDPSRLVSIPTLDDPSLAPAGGHVLYVLEPAPNLAGRVDWHEQKPRMRERLLTFLADAGYPTDIVTDRLYTPLEWRAMGMDAGTPFGLSHAFSQTGPFRPRNVLRDVPGLVFAGSTTTPGVGLPMVLISGKLAAERVRRGWR